MCLRRGKDFFTEAYRRQAPGVASKMKKLKNGIMIFVHKQRSTNRKERAEIFKTVNEGL